MLVWMDALRYLAVGVGALSLVGCGTSRVLLTDPYQCAEVSYFARDHSVEVVLTGMDAVQVTEFYICPDYATWIEPKTGSRVTVETSHLYEIVIGRKDSLRGSRAPLGFLAGFGMGLAFVNAIPGSNGAGIESGLIQFPLAAGLVGSAIGLLGDLSTPSVYRVSMWSKK